MVDALNIAALLVTLAAVLSYLNYRFVRLPSSIGLMLTALLLSLVVIGLGALGIHFDTFAAQTLAHIDFNQTLMQGMLSFLLFAGALHVNLNDLLRQKWTIAVLASVGVLVSTAAVGLGAYLLFGLLGVDMPLIYCLLFGALISPTDPIAVLGILKKAGVSKDLEIKITGESLFNDGVAVVVFLVLLGIAAGGHEVSAGAIAVLFLQEAVGGALFGLAAGYLAYRLLRDVDEYTVEVLITLALVMGGYALATALHLSGPIAIVVAGLLIGNHGRSLAMSEHTREHLDTFWELVDEILNAVLFVLIGLEVLVLSFELSYLWAAALIIPLVLLARLVSVSLPALLPRLRIEFNRHVIKVLTWGGLRGGISVALALSLPAGEHREALLAVTYCVVVFSILVQGLTIGRLVRSAA